MKMRPARETVTPVGMGPSNVATTSSDPTGLTSAAFQTWGRSDLASMPFEGDAPSTERATLARSVSFCDLDALADLPFVDSQPRNSAAPVASATAVRVVELNRDMKGLLR